MFHGQSKDFLLVLSTALNCGGAMLLLPRFPPTVIYTVADIHVLTGVHLEARRKTNRVLMVISTLSSDIKGFWSAILVYTASKFTEFSIMPLTIVLECSFMPD